MSGTRLPLQRGGGASRGTCAHTSTSGSRALSSPPAATPPLPLHKHSETMHTLTRSAVEAPRRGSAAAPHSKKTERSPFVKTPGKARIWGRGRGKVSAFLVFLFLPDEFPCVSAAQRIGARGVNVFRLFMYPPLTEGGS